MFPWFAPSVRRGLFALAIIIVVAGGASAAGLTHALTVYGGFTVFNRPDFDSVVFVEFPFALNRHEFEFFHPDSARPDLEARVFAQVTVYGVDGMPVDSTYTYFGVKSSDDVDSHQEGLKLLNSLMLVLKPGLYSARLKIIDAVSKKEGEAFYDRLVVEPPRHDGPALGGLCLAYDVTYVGDSLRVPANQMPKNGFSVRCNPLGVYSTEDTAMYVYGELYNLAWSPEAPTKYKVAYTATNRAGMIQREFGVQDRTKVGETAVISGQLDIVNMPVGYYDLWVVATDLADARVDSQKIAFTIMEPFADTLPAMAATERFDPYDTLALPDRLNLVYYLLDPVERKNLKKLDDAGKAAFLERYWQEKDSDPTTPEIENRRQMVDRYEYANKEYSTDENKTDGWHSDQGRVLMKYGLYDDMDDIPHPLEGNPYQVWHYYSLEEGGVFVFEDREGYGVYTLVHSNVRGEIYNSAWAARLKTDDTYRMD